MDVLIVGFGRMGQIKAPKWRELGRKVYAYDVDSRKQAQAKAAGFEWYDPTRRYQDLIVDISTPASFHIDSLQWVLENISPRPRTILVEKPLASDQAELAALNELLAKEHLLDIREKIVVNESYYLSTGLEFVANDIQQRGSTILSVRTELSKNRLEDVQQGRFIDPHLGSLGIELPHMIAMIQRLGFAIGDLAVNKVTVHQDPTTPHNEGFTAELRAGEVPIVMASYLGTFRVDAAGKVVPQTAHLRTLEVKTSHKEYVVELDPAHGLPRYHARITFGADAAEPTEIVIPDDHLALHLKKLHESQEDEVLDFLFSTHNAGEITRFMLSLKQAATSQKVTTRDATKVK